jgi:adenosylcobinamide hydrolase
MQPTLTVRDETVGPDGPSPVPLLVWRFAEPRLCVSSAVLGGGTGPRHWIVNASVPITYSRTDPAHHLVEIATALGLDGEGVGLMTAVDVRNFHTAEDSGVHATATVGLGSPAWAAAPDGHLRREGPGTINIVAALPVRLSGAALVNAVVTATEAKAQALWESGVEATGTASDAICVHCPAGGPSGGPEIEYAGPRSDWGARLARAVHAAVLVGSREWLAGRTTWRA